MIVLSHNKESASHENDQPQKGILSYFEPDNLEWVRGEIGTPPLNVSGVAHLLHGMPSFNKRHQLEFIRRTLETMVRDKLLEKIAIYEHRQDTTQSGNGKGVWCRCSRYGLPGSCRIMRDEGGKHDATNAEVIRID